MADAVPAEDTAREHVLAAPGLAGTPRGQDAADFRRRFDPHFAEFAALFHRL